MPNRPVEIPKGGLDVPETLAVDAWGTVVSFRNAISLLEGSRSRIQDPQVMQLVKQIIKAGGKLGIPQWGPFSPLAANIYLNELDWFFDAIRRKTAEGDYEAVGDHQKT